MGDLDINLIKEFSSRPGLYDRNNKYYKDRMYIINSWNEMSKKLGFEIRLLKERMLQLRNRYNLEIRRVEMLREKYPNRAIRSQWPLFKLMDFMNGHIKHRRSFNKMKTRLYKPNQNEEISQLSQPPPMTRIGNHQNNDLQNSNNFLSHSDSKYNRNGDVDVKCETHLENEYDSRSLMANIQDNSVMLDEETQEGSYRPSDDILEPVTEMKTSMHYIKMPNSFQATTQFPSPSNYNENDSKLKLRMQKYESFGRFIAFSLCEMSEIKAAKMITKFTTELSNDIETNGFKISTVASHSSTHTATSAVAAYNAGISNSAIAPTSTSNTSPLIEDQSKLSQPGPSGINNSNHSNHSHLSSHAQYMSNFDNMEYEDNDDHIIYDLTEDEPPIQREDLQSSSV